MKLAADRQTECWREMVKEQEPEDTLWKLRQEEVVPAVTSKWRLDLCRASRVIGAYGPVEIRRIACCGPHPKDWDGRVMVIKNVEIERKK